MCGFICVLQVSGVKEPLLNKDEASGSEKTSSTYLPLEALISISDAYLMGSQTRLLQKNIYKNKNFCGHEGTITPCYFYYFTLHGDELKKSHKQTHALSFVTDDKKNTNSHSSVNMRSRE